MFAGSKFTVRHFSSNLLKIHFFKTHIVQFVLVDVSVSNVYLFIECCELHA